jgi:phosphatidylserine/phosphatidylglycerophosphate/cardiolipin synthase-like enzyme
MKRARRTLPWGLLLVILLSVLACIGESGKVGDGGNPQPTALPAPTQAPGDQGWYQVYFTDPTDPNASSYEGGPDEALAAAIDQARASVDMAMYSLNIWSIRDALLAAHQRGVQVRLVTESDNMDEEEVQQLIDAGIQVIGDRRESLMHNKFVVIDRYEVWTGSTNLTVGGVYRNDNNLIRIRSARLAEDYTTSSRRCSWMTSSAPTARPIRPTRR